MTKTTKKNRESITLRLDPQLVEVLDNISFMRGCSRVALIRILLIERLAQLGFIPAPILQKMGLAPIEQPSPFKIEKEG